MLDCFMDCYCLTLLGVFWNTDLIWLYIIISKYPVKQNIIFLFPQTPEVEQISMISTELASKFLFNVGFKTKKSLR